MVSRLDPGRRWLPKKSALSLATYRATPASIHSRQEGTIDFNGLAALDPAPDPAKPAAPRPARASPEDIPFVPPESRFCPIEKCPPDTLPGGATCYAPPASSITRRLERLRLNRRLLSVSEITQSP